MVQFAVQGCNCPRHILSAWKTLQLGTTLAKCGCVKWKTSLQLWLFVSWHCGSVGSTISRSAALL